MGSPSMLQIIGGILSLIWAPLMIHYLWTRKKERDSRYAFKTEELLEKWKGGAD